ncbi:MAG TPA: transposase [Longimicrobiales bacterium]|nr:transposase [Longimicrobiales bacterium]
MRKSFEYKAKLSPSAARRAEGQLALCAELYNAALQERRDSWKQAQVSVSAVEQMRQLKEIKQIRPEFLEVDAQVLQGVIQRLDKAFQAFFRRVKSGQTPGYPRFRSRHRYDSLTFKQTGWKLGPSGAKRTLTLRGIGDVKLFWSRDTEGQIKTVTLKRDRCGDWFVTFSCDGVPERPLPETGEAVGVDLGLEKFLTTSSGEVVENPRHLRGAEVRLKRTSRRVSKRRKGGQRRWKMARTLARKHRKVQRTRRDFHFKTARKLVEKYDLIAVENLNVRGLSRGALAKSVGDAGWSQFIEILSFKAAEAGRRVVTVDPRGTSQVCSGCGCEPKEKKTLSARVHRCGECGLVLDRDHNAARNVLHLAMSDKRGRAGPSASSPASKAAA